MLEFVKRFLKDTTIYALEPVLTKGIIFLLVPLYTSCLSPADFGNLQYILTFGAFFTAFIDLGLFSSFWKYRSESSPYGRDEVVLNTVLTIVFCGCCLLMISILFKTVFAQRSLLGWLVIIYFGSAVVRKVFETALLLMRANFKATLYVTASVIHAVFLLGTNVLFVAHFRMNFSGIIYSYLITSIAISGAFCCIIMKDMGGKINLQLIKDMLGYGAPIMAANLAAIAISLSDRFFLKAYSTDSELGLYSYGCKFAELIQVLLVNSFFLAWNPLRWEIYEMKNGKEIFARFYRVFLMGLPILALLLLGFVLLLAPYVTFNSEYLKGFRIIAIVTFSYVFHGMYYFNAMGMLFEKKTMVIMLIIMGSGVTSLVLNYFLVPPMGMLGAALAGIASYLQMFLLGRYFSQRYYVVERNPIFEFSQIGLTGIAIILVTGILYSVQNIQIAGFFALLCALFYFAVNVAAKNISVANLKTAVVRILG
jgi:O-antigen/teichoic acid export membrane protein